jgi:hypothetical protein
MIDAAVLDIRLDVEDVFPLADTLREKRIPFFFVTGLGKDALPKRFRKGCRLGPQNPDSFYDRCGTIAPTACS